MSDVTVAIRGRLQEVVDAAGSRSWPAVRSAAVPAAIVLLALFLRTYRLHLMTFGDTYEQLTATKRLLSADFPISRIYPSGVAVILAAPLSVLPRTIATVQGVITASSIALVATAYFATRRATGDALAATILSLAIACSPRMVLYGRVGFFDAINALGIVLAVFLVPALRGRSLIRFIVYGAFLAVVVGIRTTNIFVLPAVVVYWIDPGRRWPTRWNIRGALLRKGVVAAGATFVVCSIILLLMATAVGQAANAPYSARDYLLFVTLYEIFVFSDYLAWLVIPLAVFGAGLLWKRNPTIVLVATYMTVAWPVSHAVVPFFNIRYMLPGIYFGSFLAAHGASEVIRRSGGRRMLGACIVTVLLGGVATQLLEDGYMIKGWPARAATGQEAVYRELRPRIGDLPPGSLVVTARSRGLRDSEPHVQYLDLIYQALPGGVSQKNIEAMLQSIRDAESQGREVYYLYSNVEASDESKAGPNFYSYYSAVADEFLMTEIYRSRSVDTFRLYRVGAPRRAGFGLMR